MLREPTIEKLYDLRLPVMATSWQEQERDDKLRALDFDERFGLLVEAEHRARDNRRLQRLLKQAELRLPDACMEDVDPGAARGLPATTTRQLATGAWRERAFREPRLGRRDPAPDLFPDLVRVVEGLNELELDHGEPRARGGLHLAELGDGGELFLDGRDDLRVDALRRGAGACDGQGAEPLRKRRIFLPRNLLPSSDGSRVQRRRRKATGDLAPRSVSDYVLEVLRCLTFTAKLVTFPGVVFLGTVLLGLAMFGVGCATGNATPQDSGPARTDSGANVREDADTPACRAELELRIRETVPLARYVFVEADKFDDVKAKLPLYPR